MLGLSANLAMLELCLRQTFNLTKPLFGQSESLLTLIISRTSSWLLTHYSSNPAPVILHLRLGHDRLMSFCRHLYEFLGLCLVGLVLFRHSLPKVLCQGIAQSRGGLMMTSLSPLNFVDQACSKSSSDPTHTFIDMT